MESLPKVFFFDTQNGKKVEFIPKEKGMVTMYVCGITPYSDTHLGHARCYVTFDVIYRLLEYLGYRVIYIQNFTDIDDKIIQRAAELNISPSELAERYIQEYFHLMDKLNIKKATKYPRVTEHIPVIIQAIGQLIQAGYGYTVPSEFPAQQDVYFLVREVPHYGKLSHRNPDELLAGARLEIDSRKKTPLDFALWKSSPPEEPGWDSPWGRGRPGWHIECSVMARKYLGDEFDLHGGGQDLIFPHHENEIAQSWGLNQKVLARYWIHNGFVTVNEEKMSKSLGNIFTLKDLLAQYNPEIIRYFLLMQHYRRPLNFTYDLLTHAQMAIERIYQSLENAEFFLSKNQREGKIQGEGIRIFQEFARDFQQVICDDFNTPQALAVIHKLASRLNQIVNGGTASAGTVEYGEQIMRHLGGILGFLFRRGLNSVDKEIDNLIQRREEARHRKDFDQADALRQILEEKGIILEDTPFGTRWRRKD